MVDSLELCVVPQLVVGAVLIAFIEVFGAAYVSSKLPDLFVFGVLIVMLMFRPAGLLGTATVEKV